MFEQREAPFEMRSTAALQQGLTLVEVVAVLVIVGILAAVTGPRFFDDRTFLARGYYEELAAALKYAQRLAVASGCPVAVQVTAAGYQARQQAAPGVTCNSNHVAWSSGAQLADSRVLAGTSPVGVGAAPAVSFAFDALGHTNLAANQVISVGPFALTVAASGYVEAP